MHKHFSCIQGHQWQVPVDNVLALAVASISCPHCGGAAETVLPESSVLSASAPPPAPVASAAAKAPPTMQRDEAAETMAAVPEAVAALAEFLTPPQAADELGRLGPYRILKVLGVGGMGMVLHAEDTQLQRPVALKVMQPTLAVRGDARQRFLREARAAAALKHERIVAIYQVGEDRGCPYLAMELLEGEPLDSRLAREHVLPVPDVLRIGREIAEGLAAAHDKGMVHRDIKPANIWLETIADCGLRIADSKQSAIRNPQSAIDRVKILDFGLVRLAEEETQLTQLGDVVGTPAYMAPEQAQSHAFDRRADLFSLGCVLYTMSTGTRPFQGKNTAGILRALVGQEPPSPRERNADLPEELSALIMKLLAKQPAQRPQSAQEVIAVLQRIEGERKAPAQPAPRQRRSRVALVAGLLLALVVLGAAAAYLIRISTPEGDFYVEVENETVAVAVDKQGGIKLIDRQHKDRQYWIKARESKTLPAGEYELAITDMDAGLEFNAHTFTIKGKDAPASVRVWFKKAPAKQKAPPAAPAAKAFEEVRRIPTPWNIGNLVTVPSSSLVIYGAKDGKLRLWNYETGKEEACWQAHADGTEIRCLRLAPSDAKWLYSFGDDGTLQVSDLAKKERVRTIELPDATQRSFDISPDGKHIVTGGGDSQQQHLWILDAATGKQLAQFTRAEYAHQGRWGFGSPVFCSDRLILYCGNTSPMTLFDWKDKKHVFKGLREDQCFDLTVSRDGRWALSGHRGRPVDGKYDYSAPSAVRLWDLHDHSRPPRYLGTHADGVCAVALSPDGQLGLTGDLGGIMKLWDLKAGKELHQFEVNMHAKGPFRYVFGVAFSPDGRYVLGSCPPHLKVWRLPDPDN